MDKITIRDKEANVANQWQDLTVEQYIDITKLYEQTTETIEEDFLINFLLIITDLDRDFIETLYEDELEPFVETIKKFDMKEFKGVKVDHFILNDQIYSYKQASKLTLGEKVSLKLLEKKSTTQTETWLNILSIMIRPAKVNKNEFGEDIYIVEPFDGDIETLEKRKELIKKIKAINAFYIVEGFIDGRE